MASFTNSRDAAILLHRGRNQTTVSVYYNNETGTYWGLLAADPFGYRFGEGVVWRNEDLSLAGGLFGTNTVLQTRPGE